MVLIFSDLNRVQVYKKPYRVSSYDRIELGICFNYVNLFRANEHMEDHHIRKPNDENFLLEIQCKKYIFVGDKIVSFDTSDKIVKYSSDHGFNDIKFPYAYIDENLYFMLYQKYLIFVENANSTEKQEYLCLH